MVVTDYDMRKAATPPALSEVELLGKKLFVQRCALCHDLRGQPATTTVGPWIDREVVKARGDAAVRQKITQGSPRMPAWQYTLEPPQVDAVIAYLKTVSPDLRYKPGGAVAVPID
jgi:mono/diheme cytochrome c family protein